MRLRDRLLSIPQSGFLWGAIVAVLAVLVGTVLVALAIVQIPLVREDQPAWVGNTIAGGAFALAAIAAIIAISAYTVSLRRPVLEAEIKFRYCDWNKPVLAALPPRPDGRRPLVVQTQRGHSMLYTRQGEAEVRIHNRVRWSARNPALRVELSDMGFLRENPGWRVEKQDSLRGTSSIIWEGGADRPIHGEWTASLPDLNFAEVQVLGSNPAITLDAVAEGFRELKRLPVILITEDDLGKRMSTYGDQR